MSLPCCGQRGGAGKHGKGVLFAQAVEGGDGLEHVSYPSGANSRCCVSVSLPRPMSIRSKAVVTDDLKNWTPRPRPERKVLEGAMSGWSRSSAAAHGDGLYAAATAEDDDSRFRWLSDHAPESRAAFQPWLEKVEASEDPLFFTVIDKAAARSLAARR